MDFLLSRHVKEQMERREIPEDLVMEVLRSPDQVISYEQYKVYQKVFSLGQGQFLLRAFINDTKEPPILITVYKTSKLSKYYENKI